MSRPQKILTIVLWSIAVAAMIGVVAIRALPTNSEPSTQPAMVIVDPSDPSDSADAPLPVLYDAPAFALIDQDKQPATNTQFLGHPWIADFIFTTCASLCPTMSAEMS